MWPSQRLFVYGTLAPGRPNEHVLADLDGSWEPATITGRLEERGWGAALGFPGLVLDTSGNDVVEGLLISSPALPKRWAELDEFEGPGYERVEATVRTATGKVRAFVYTLKDNPDQRI